MADAEWSLGPFSPLLLFLGGQPFLPGLTPPLEQKGAGQEEKVAIIFSEDMYLPEMKANSQQFPFSFSSSLCTFSSPQKTQSRITTANLQW